MPCAKATFSDAARAYDKAAEIARSRDSAKETVYLKVRQAQCYENNKNHAAAADELIAVAKSFPQQSNAAAIHLRGCWNFAKTLSDNSERKIQFQEKLQQQSLLWPKQEPSNQARLWLGDHFQNQGSWEKAIQAYLSVMPESSKSLTAAEQISATIQRWESRDSKGNKLEMAKAVRRLIDEQLDFNSKTTWTEGQRLLLLEWLDAGLRLGVVRPETGLAMIESASNEVGDIQQDWQQHAKTRRLVLLMKRGTAESELSELVRQLPNSNRVLKSLVELVDDCLGLEQQNKYAALMTIICNKAMLDPNAAADLSFWQLRKANSSIASGQADQVVADLASLASENPRSLEIQLTYGRVLSRLPKQRKEAMKQWRRLAAKVKPGSEAWFESKFNVVNLLLADGKSEEAVKLVEYLKATSPAWSESAWSEKFDQLLKN